MLHSRRKAVMWSVRYGNPIADSARRTRSSVKEMSLLVWWLKPAQHSYSSVWRRWPIRYSSWLGKEDLLV